MSQSLSLKCLVWVFSSYLAPPDFSRSLWRTEWDACACNGVCPVLSVYSPPSFKQLHIFSVHVHWLNNCSFQDIEFVTTRMISALRWAAMWAILMFHELCGPSRLSGLFCEQAMYTWDMPFVDHYWHRLSPVFNVFRLKLLNQQYRVDWK